MRAAPSILVAAFGTTVGHVAFGHDWWTVVVVTTVAVISGVVSAIGTIAWTP